MRGKKVGFAVEKLVADTGGFEAFGKMITGLLQYTLFT